MNKFDPNHIYFQTKPLESPKTKWINAVLLTKSILGQCQAWDEPYNVSYSNCLKISSGKWQKDSHQVAKDSCIALSHNMLPAVQSAKHPPFSQY